MGFDCAARSHVGLKRKLNEDSLLECGGRRLWAVADGMGGHQAGEVASAMVCSALSKMPDAESAEASVRHVFSVLQDVNRELIELAGRSYQDRTIGTTVVGLVADQTSYKCFWVGDSRAYRLRSGVVEQLTRDHSLVQDLVDAGMLQPEEAEGHPNANVVTRAVGAMDVLRVDMVGGDLQSGDTFLLASDGLTRLVNKADLEVVLAEPDLSAAGDRLIEISLERGAPDNVTLVLVRFH